MFLDLFVLSGFPCVTTFSVVNKGRGCNAEYRLGCKLPCLTAREGQANTNPFDLLACQLLSSPGSKRPVSTVP